MAKIEVYSKEWCPYCAKAKTLLRSKQLDYEEIDITSDAEGEQNMIMRSRRRTVPQIFVDKQSVGGYDDLAQLNATGELDRLLNAEQVDGLTVKDLETGKTRWLNVQGVFIEIGLYPNTDFVLDLLDTNEHGEIKVDSCGQTGINGVFAAGDVTDSHDKQIVIAAGAGANAALGAFEYLVTQH